MLMIVLDATIVNVALPSIRSDLGFTQSSLAWVVNAYLIAFGGVLLLAGRLGDLLGRRRVFLTGLALFTAASLLCGLSIGQEMLVAARFVQGVGGAMASAVTLGMIVTLFTEPRERARAIGIYSFVAAGGASIGLLAGGVLTQALNWHWIFMVNVPIGIATAFFAMRLLESDRGMGLGRGADVIGSFLVMISNLLVDHDGISDRLILHLVIDASSVQGIAYDVLPLEVESAFSDKLPEALNIFSAPLVPRREEDVSSCASPRRFAFTGSL
jgi:MFS family permease